MTRKIALLAVCTIIAVGQVFAQARTITGKVVDEKGAPLQGATITVKSGTSTTTTAKGSFSLSIDSSVKQVEVSYVGFASQKIAIGTQNDYTIRLRTSDGSLEGVVITGYLTVKKSAYAGAAAKVPKEQLNYVPNASFDQILQGRSPGLLVTVGSGQPGSSARVQIRGQSSVTGGNSPLYILDGMPIEDGVFQSLNPNDFESVDVLRDAVATAQYGNRGSGGIIAITTKKGKAGKPVLNYNGQFGITEPGIQKFEMMNSDELLRFQEMLGLQLPNGLPGWVNSKLNPTYASASPAEQARRDRTLDSLRGINTDWQDVFQRNGSFQSHDLNLSGGAGGTKFYLSGGYYKEEGIGLRSDLERYTVRANIDHKSDKLTLGFNSGFGYTKRNFIESEGGLFLANPFAAAYLAVPYQSLYNADGTVNVGQNHVGPNAYDRISTTAQNSGQIKATANLTVNYDITKNIYIGGYAGIDYRQTVAERSDYPNTYSSNNDDFPVGPDRAAGDTVGGGAYSTGYNHNMEYIVRGIAGYHNVFKEKHALDLKFVSEYTKDNTSAFNYIGYGLEPKLPNTPAAITPGTVGNGLIPDVGGSKAERAMYAAILFANYSYEDKYTLNASIRRDASSQLPPDTRWTNIYGIGATWNVLNENFAANWRKITDLHFRISYGSSASADNFSQGWYGWRPLYGSGTYAGAQTIVPANAGNPELKWEQVNQLNVGIDFGFFQNRIRGSVDVYDRQTNRAIVKQKLPLESGFREQDINAGTIQNKGVELVLSGDIFRTKDLTWSIGGNISYNKNRVKSLDQVEEFEQGTEIVKEGLPLGSHYIVKWAGVDAASGNPLYYTKDGKLTDLYSEDNAVAEFGTNNAPWIGGFNTTVTYKGFSFDAFFNFQQGFSRFTNQDFFQMNHAFALQEWNMRKEMLNMWQKPGDVTNIQNAVTERQFSSKDIQDASYLRFRNVTLAYTFPKSILEKLRIVGNLRLFVQGQNLYTWTNWLGFDPEDDNNIATYEYPVPRTYTAGINLTFK